MSKHVTTWLEAHHDGELQGSRLQRVEKHLSQCASCRAELESLQKLSALLQQSAAPKPLTPPEQFVAQVGLQLPRHQKQPLRRKVLRIAWTMIPLGLLGLLVLAQTILIVSGVILNILKLGLGVDVTTGLLPIFQQRAWQMGVSGPAEVTLSSLFTTILHWLRSGGPLGWEITLCYSLLLVFGLLYWSWLTGWWVYRQHQQRLN